jgi:hypothetical protein
VAWEVKKHSSADALPVGLDAGFRRQVRVDFGKHVRDGIGKVAKPSAVRERLPHLLGATTIDGAGVASSVFEVRSRVAPRVRVIFWIDPVGDAVWYLCAFEDGLGKSARRREAIAVAKAHLDDILTRVIPDGRQGSGRSHYLNPEAPQTKILFADWGVEPDYGPEIG